MSKDSFDIFADSSAEAFQVGNQASDIAALVERLREAVPDYMVVGLVCRACTYKYWLARPAE